MGWLIGWILAKKNAQKALEEHRTRVPIDHPDRSVLRTKIEYPTENVSFSHLAAIDKVGGGLFRYSSLVVTKDVLVDKSVFGVVQPTNVPMIAGRYNDANNTYVAEFYTPAETADHRLVKIVGGDVVIIAEESVDIGLSGQGLAISCSGSSIKSMRWDTGGFLDPLSLPTPTATISATDTDLASGRFGYRFLDTLSYQGGVAELSAYLLPPLTSLPPAKAVIECEVTEEEVMGRALVPRLRREPIEVDRIEKAVPDYIKCQARIFRELRNRGLEDSEIAMILGYLPQSRVDIAAVTWGAFDYKQRKETMVIVVTNANPYSDKAIEKQVEFARSVNLRVSKPPRDYREAIQQYKTFRKDHEEWIAGKDNWAYITLGQEVFELFQVADTYYGNIVDKIKPDAYKYVPDWEMYRTINMWLKRLERVTVLTEERDKHIRKLREVLRVGW